MPTVNGGGVVKERKVQKLHFAQVSAVESTSMAQPAGAAATRPYCAHKVVHMCVCVCGAALGVLYEVKRRPRPFVLPSVRWTSPRAL